MTQADFDRIDARVLTSHQEAVAEAARHRDAAQGESDRANVAYHRAFDAYSKRDNEGNARRLDAAYVRVMAAMNAARSGRQRYADLTDPLRAERVRRDEREKRVRLAELREKKQAEKEQTAGAAPRTATPRAGRTSVTVEVGGRKYPTVEDTGDGLAAMDRGRLRELARENDLSVGGHKATLVERLRAAGVTA